MRKEFKTFKDLSFNPILGGKGARILFDNGYGVSVVSPSFSYGGSCGLYELAVLLNNDICYTTPITSDVLGWLTPRKVSNYMRKVQELEPVIELPK